MNLHKYDNEVQADNKFGHVLSLMSSHLPRPAESAIHLDIACGFGHIAEPIIDAFGVDYVGVDIDAEFIKDILDRGHEGHVVNLESAALADELKRIIGDRRLASVTFLDGLEHLMDGSHALRAIGEVIAEHRTVAFTSVPNVTHMDIVLKQVLGQWHYTEAGLLDKTHYTLYSEASLQEAVGAAGMARVAANDVYLGRSDQHFPLSNAVLSENASISRFLRGVRAGAETCGEVNQFVWALAPAPIRPAVDTESDTAAPFLSVIMRTQGRRPQELREALLSLAAQSCQDFEVLLVAHKVTYEQQLVVERVIADQVPDLQARIRLLRLDTGQRSAPINLGIEEARGRYLSIFDDDDIVFGNWVEDFVKAARTNDGQILRSVSLRQDTTVVDVLGSAGLRSNGAPKRVYEAEFSMTKHVAANQSPPIAWIFPASLCRDFGLRFDDSMTTMEDWEFLLRGAQLVGVKDTGRVGALYRWWQDRDSSRTEHPADEWRQNQNEINRRVDARPFLLPAGDTRRLREDMLRLVELERLVKRQRKQIAELKGEPAGRASEAAAERPVVSRARRLVRKSRTAARNPRLVSQRVQDRLRRS